MLSVVAGTVRASNAGVDQAVNGEKSASTVTDRAAKFQIMPQRNVITPLIQLEADALVLITPKVFVDFSAVMDRRFGRICGGKRAGRACRRISQPARVID